MAWRTLATTWLVLVFVPVACGSEGSGSGGADAGSTSSSAAGAGGAMGGAGGGSAGDASGGSEVGGGGGGQNGPTCEEACEHVQECGLPCSLPCESACVLGCTLAASCRELAELDASWQSCAGACDAGIGCKTCIGDPRLGCNEPIAACLADMACKAWSDCGLVCGDAACFAACDAIHVAAAPLYDAVYSCFCGSMCKDLCSTFMGLRCG